MIVRKSAEKCYQIHINKECSYTSLDSFDKLYIYYYSKRFFSDFAFFFNNHSLSKFAVNYSSIIIEILHYRRLQFARGWDILAPLGNNFNSAVLKHLPSITPIWYRA